MSTIFNTFGPEEWLLVVLIFIWSGFVRSGLGFGGVALALPFMLLVRLDPLFWLPITALHLLFFTFLTVIRRMSNVDWMYLRRSIKIMIVPKIIGVFGLVVLPPAILALIVYVIILAVALSYIFNVVLNGKDKRAEYFFLILGGYASGTSLIGAPLIVAAYNEHVAIKKLRDTLFVLWFVLVCIKMSALLMLNVPLQWQFSLLLLPASGLGHFLGLKAHKILVGGNAVQFRRYMGFGLAGVSIVGLVNLLLD